MITKRAKLQFDNICAAANMQSLCVSECFNIATGKREYVLCSHTNTNSGVTFYPLAKLFNGNPNMEITPPNTAAYRLI